MASVTITIPDSSIGGLGSNQTPVYQGSPGSYPELGTALSATGTTTLFLGYLILPRNNFDHVNLRLSSSQTTPITQVVQAGPEFSDVMESEGSIKLIATDGATVTITGIGDATEPYSWVPANTAAVKVFSDNLLGLADRTLTITFDDNQTQLFERVSGVYVPIEVYERVSGAYVSVESFIRQGGVYVQ